MGDAESLLDNHEFVTDCARYAEGLLSEKAVKKKYRFTDDVWQSLGDDEQLVEAIELEKTRRIRNGATARERAQQLFAKAPDVLGNILNDDSASPRHRIEASKELRTVAANGPEATPAAERFTITINLGADEKIRIDKALGKVDQHAGELLDATPQPALEAKKDGEKDGGEPW